MNNLFDHMIGVFDFEEPKGKEMTEINKEQLQKLAKYIDEKAEAVNHPPHYNKGKIEVIDYIEDLGMGEDFCAGNAIKYLSRYKYKEKPLEDLKKARWYIDRLIQQYEKK
jgi:hypothetical protein